MNRAKAIIIISAFLITLPGIITGHDMWIEMQSFRVAAGSRPAIKFPSDHTFPARNNEYVPAKRMMRSYILSPEGSAINLIRGDKDIYRTGKALVKPGTYLAVSGKKWTYWVKTTEGYQEGKDKTMVRNALKGILSGKFCKAVIWADKPGGTAYARRAGHELEIIPLSDPGTLKKGDKLRVRILLNNRPVPLDVKATYEGYSRKKDSFAFETRSNNKGICDIPLKKKGKWIIAVSHRINVKDRRYDEKLYSATLTFEIL